MEAAGIPHFDRREIGEPHIDYDFETCQRVLLGQAEGRLVDPQADRHLIDQIDASVVEDLGQGAAMLACRTQACRRQCIVQSEMGILREVDSDGSCIKQNIGRAAIR